VCVCVCTAVAAAADNIVLVLLWQLDVYGSVTIRVLDGGGWMCPPGLRLPRQ